MEITRKLASVRRILDIKPIKDADRIVCATVDGWELVTQKDNNFQIGDLVLYFEIDSFLPVIPQFEFLRKSSFKSTKNLGDGFRIKTIKLKGQVSQGLILPLKDAISIASENPEFGDVLDWTTLNEGDDLTDILMIQKYEKPIPSNLAGKMRGNFPSFIPKTDQERVQNIFNKFKNKYEDVWYDISMKLDGSSMTVYSNEGLVSVCSRNIDLIETEDNLFWKVANSTGLVTFLRNNPQYNIAIQGELMGPGVQGNREGFSDYKLFVFDIWDIKNQCYFGFYDKKAILTIIRDAGVIIDEVPSINCLPVFKLFNAVNDILNSANIPSINHEYAEGIVFKALDGSHSFKAISNRFLLSEKD